MVVKETGSMLLASGCESLFLVTFQEFTINGSEQTCYGLCIQLQAVTETVLINLHAFTVTGSEGVGDGVCFQLQALMESDFSKASGLYDKWQ